MASGEAEPLQYTTTVLRVSIHCEGCKKKVRKVLLGIEGVYKVTIDATQHKVTVTGSVAADALVRRLLKSGKQATLWPVPAPPAAEAKKEKPEEVVVAPSAGESGKGAGKADTKPKKVAEEAEPESSEKKPEKGKSSEKPEEDKLSEKKPKDEAKEKEVPEKKEKGSPEPAVKEANAEEAGGEKTVGKKGKKKNKQKDAGGDGDIAAEKPPPQQQQQPKTKPQPQPQQAMVPVQGPDRAHGGAFPYYPPQPVMSYNMAHPSASVSYYAPTPVVSMPPMPQHIPYGYSPYPPMMMPPPPPEFMYGPPGMRSSPPQESYSNMFNEENPSSCSLM
ncbi:unnamed protein product [Alopecurus aequalis]